MKRQLPSQPNLEQLRIQAKELLKAHQSHDPEAIQRIRENHPRFGEASDIREAKLRLSDAQLVIAREYGFTSWPKLKEHLDNLEVASEDPMTLLHKAFKGDDHALVRRLLQRHPQFKARINNPIGDFGSPAITCARSAEMIDVLLEAGADINAKSNWWAGGFGLLHSGQPELARHAIQRGALVDVHAAARLGMLDRLRELITANPELVHARGGDGQTALHFASTVEIAEYLLNHGADINARDVDHESTPAQYMVRDRQEVARYLVQRDCQTDILMATALGDEPLVRKHLEMDPSCIHMRVSDEFFPMIHPKGGGIIYQWTLGWYVSAHQVAKDFRQEHIFELLMERSPASLKLITACWLGDEVLFNSIRRDQQVFAFTAVEKRQLAHAACQNETTVVRLMLEAGLPVDARSRHNATALHWAAWQGNAEVVRLLLQHNPPLEDARNDFTSTPLGWAIHGSQNSWHPEKGDYPKTVELLLQAGAKIPERTDGTPEVRAVLRRFK
jgi:ankyrin repeat protein